MRRRRAALGHRLRHQVRVVRQHHRHAQGRHPRRRLRAGAAQDRSTQVRRNARRLQGRGGRQRQGRRPRGPDRHRHRPAGRAAVRGPDQGGAGHRRGPRHRRRVVDTRARRALLDLDQAGEKAQAGAVLDKVVGACPHPGRGPPAQGDAAPQERAGDLRRCRPSSPTAAATTSSAASCSSSRATPRSAPPSWPATREFQALLPIRGKILNVQKASVADMLKNAECASIIQVIGAGSGPHLRPRVRRATARSS